MRNITALFLGIGVSGVAASATMPAAMSYDDRVRAVSYNADDVVRIQGSYGTLTDITFANDETIQSTALGDSLAWEIAPVGNHLFIKPTEQNANTNMSVTTNKRTYAFDLVTVDKTHVKVFYRVKFTYPNEEAAARADADRETHEQVASAVAAAEAIRKQREQAHAVDNALHDAEIPTRHSVNYWIKGADEVQPDEAFDDGQFTYFRFRGNREFPVVYLKDGHGDESLVNVTVKGDTLMVQRIAKDYVLRKGEDVALVTNPNYDRVGIATGTGTITPTVQRAVKGERDPLPDTMPTQQPVAKVAIPLPGATPVPEHDDRPIRTIPDAPSEPIMPNARPVPQVEHSTPAAPAAMPTAAISSAPISDSAVAVKPSSPAPSTPYRDLSSAAVTYDLADALIYFEHGANVRGRPTSSSALLGFIPPGAYERFSGYDESHTWYRITTQDVLGQEVTGYVVVGLGGFNGRPPADAKPSPLWASAPTPHSRPVRRHATKAGADLIEASTVPAAPAPVAIDVPQSAPPTPVADNQPYWQPATAPTATSPEGSDHPIGDAPFAADPYETHHHIHAIYVNETDQ